MKIKVTLLTAMLSFLIIQIALAQPVFVKAIPNNSYGFFEANETLYFFHQDSLWKSNGSAAGTLFIKDLGAPGVPYGEEGFSIPSGFFFETYNGVSYSLWRSNGTAAGTTVVGTYSQLHMLEVFNNEFYFSVLEGGTWKLYKISAGTPVLIMNLNVPEAEVVGNTLMFEVVAAGGRELWKTNGTAAGTGLVKAFPGMIGIEDMTEVNGILFFELQGNDGLSELWKSNGTAGGTVMVKSFTVDSVANTDLHQFTEYHGQLVFVESLFEIEYLHISDGTAAGTRVLQEFIIGIDTWIENLSVANDLVYFTVRTQYSPGVLWITNGTVDGTQIIHFQNAYGGAREFTTVANHVLYADHTDVDNMGEAVTSNDSYQLWQSDLSTVNTKPVEEIFPPATFPGSDNLTEVNKQLFFTTPGMGYLNLWKYNPNAPAVAAPFFTVVDANTDEDRAWLMEGDTIVVYPGQNINIRLNSIVNPGSVRFYLNGPTYRVENVVPFALAGDLSGDYLIWPAAQGHYTLVGEEYANDGALGALLGTQTIHFYVKKVVLPRAPIVNAGPDQIITLPVTSASLSGMASDPDGSVVETRWTVASQPLSVFASFTDYLSPNTTAIGLTEPGTYIFRLRATDDSGLSNFDEVFVTVLPAGQSVTSFTLVNATTDTDIMTITDGAVIDIAALPVNNVNIRANTNPVIVGSVRMSLNSYIRTESVAPYALYGDTGGNYDGKSLTSGSYTMYARPYTGSGASGTAGIPLTVNFTVVNSAARMGNDLALIQTSCFPNPSSDYFNIQIQSEEDGHSIVEVYDETGKLQEQIFEGTVQCGEQLQLKWNASKVHPGTYLLKIKTGYKEKIEKLVVQ